MKLKPTIDKNKYLLPVEVVTSQYSFLPQIKLYEYKVYADDKEEKYSSVKFLDINGFVVGKHIPTKLLNTYDKVILQAKTETTKVVAGIRNVMENVADIAVDAASEVKQDLTKTASLATTIISKVAGKRSKNPNSDKSSN